MDKYIVIGLNTHDSWSIGPFQVHQRKGDTVKDTQDRIAEYAGEHPEIIYTVVIESDYRQIYKDMLNNWFGPR